MLTPMLLSNDFPEDHPVLSMAMTPERVADLLVRAIDAEEFLIVESETARSALAAKARDYDAWIDATSRASL